ncbi:hypothetical protein Tco_1487382, partial [Tanacetum coccineum]
RHHDSDVNDPVPEDGFNALDVQLLTERVVDLRHVPSGLLFQGGLVTTWDFPVVTMSEYFRFPFLSDGSISKGPALTSQDCIEQHTTRPLSQDQTIPEKTDHQKMVEVEDPNIVAIRERKAQDAAKKKRKRDRERVAERALALKPKGGKLLPERMVMTPLRLPYPRNLSRLLTLLSPPKRIPPVLLLRLLSRARIARLADTLWLGTSGGQSGRAMTHVDTEVVQPSPSPRTAYHSPVATQLASPLWPIQRGNDEAGESSMRGPLYVPDWSIHQRCRLDTPMWCRELMIHLAPPAVQEESNALNNATTLERAWFSLARGALAQTDIPERFENLQTDFGELAESHAECGDLAGKLVQARLDLKHSSDLYNSLSDRYKVFRSEHEGCAGKLERLENHNRELSQRINAERAQEKEKLVSQLGKAEMEKFDCIRKLLPIVVERLFQSHEYKQSLSEPFNLAIQVGWGKGLAEERSEGDLV